MTLRGFTILGAGSVYLTFARFHDFSIRFFSIRIRISYAVELPLFVKPDLEVNSDLCMPCKQGCCVMVVMVECVL